MLDVAVRLGLRPLVHIGVAEDLAARKLRSGAYFCCGRLLVGRDNEVGEGHPFEEVRFALLVWEKEEKKEAVEAGREVEKPQIAPSKKPSRAFDSASIT